MQHARSNTDTIVVGLIVEAVTGQPYQKLLSSIIFGPAKLRQTTFATALALPKPFIHGGPVTNERVRTRTGLDRSETLRLLDALVENDRLLRIGQKRGTRYVTPERL